MPGGPGEPRGLVREAAELQRTSRDASQEANPRANPAGRSEREHGQHVGLALPGGRPAQDAIPSTMRLDPGLVLSHDTSAVHIMHMLSGMSARVIRCL